MDTAQSMLNAREYLLYTSIRRTTHTLTYGDIGTPMAIRYVRNVCNIFPTIYVYATSHFHHPEREPSIPEALRSISGLNLNSTVRYTYCRCVASVCITSRVPL
jgi:hypothetical protein